MWTVPGLTGPVGRLWSVEYQRRELVVGDWNNTVNSLGDYHHYVTFVHVSRISRK